MYVTFFIFISEYTLYLLFYTIHQCQNVEACDITFRKNLRLNEFSFRQNVKHDAIIITTFLF